MNPASSIPLVEKNQPRKFNSEIHRAQMGCCMNVIGCLVQKEVIRGRIAQSVEHGANNARVQGSSPCMTKLLTFSPPVFIFYHAYASKPCFSSPIESDSLTRHLYPKFVFNFLYNAIQSNIMQAFYQHCATTRRVSVTSNKAEKDTKAKGTLSNTFASIE